MAKSRAMSPGGALLRSSRMFSLPAQLKVPDSHKISPSPNSTTPFPTMQTITTPSTSRIRGDWGFKRPLPLKSTTKSSTPLIRVKHVDTIEQVTDFASASDHTLSLQKLHEMNIPVMLPPPRAKGYVALQELPSKSVFEEEFDVTAMDPVKARQMRDKRWRFYGPWLAGMGEGEFNKYLKGRVASRRSEFREWMKHEIAAEKTLAAAIKATEAGEAAPPQVTAKDITSADVTEKLRKLRDDRPQLYKLVGEFLDLAPIQQKEVASSSFGTILAPSGGPKNAYTEAGPPITHPSAGASYLRTNAFLENHPIYGPQAHHRHVKARMLSLSGGISNRSTGKLGVGGFVADTPGGDWQATNKGNKGHPGSKQLRFDPEVKGGRKLHIEPHSATVDASGKLKIHLKPKNPMAAYVAQQLDGEDVDTPQEEEESSDPLPKSWKSNKRSGSRTSGSSASYGISGESVDEFAEYESVDKA